MAEKEPQSQGSGCYLASNSEMEEEGEGEQKVKLHNLMDRLRLRSSQHKSWTDTTKALRISATDKRLHLEPCDRVLIQKQLETLQKTVKVTSLPLMVDCLETVSKRVGLKFSPCTADTYKIIGDMFWLEIQLHNTGMVKDVRIAHHGDPVSCSELVTALSEGNFEEFQQHLEGLATVYKIQGDKKQKSKIFLALQALETDLNTLAQLQSSINGVGNYIHKSPLGILQPRTGGQPMKMTYFVSPYDLLCVKTKSLYAMTVEAITENQLGHSVTVSVDSSSNHKLQSMPLMTVKTADGKRLPSFSAVTNVNSHQLPACFVLRLQKPIPISLSVLQKIHSTTELEVCNTASSQPLLSLIQTSLTEQQKKQQSNLDKGLYVTLPDQQHCYFITGANGSYDFHGVMVTSIPFIHPTNVPIILQLLRQQLLFNTLLASCIRRNPVSELEKSLVFDVSPLSLQQLVVTFEHPFRDTMATAEFDLSDITNIKCRVCPNGDESEKICSDDYACKILQRSLSIPVTLRAVLKSATPQLDQQLIQPPVPILDNLPDAATLSKIGQERRQAFIESRFVPPARTENMSREHVYQNQQPQLQQANFADVFPPGFNLDSYSAELLDQGIAPAELLEAMKADKVSRNPMLASLLDQESKSPDIQSAPMLSALLGDQAQSTPNPMAYPQKPRKPRKRRSQSDIHSPGSAGKSPKATSGDEYHRGSFGGSSVEMDTSPTHVFGNTPTSVAPNIQDNMLVSESHVSRLATTLDDIIKQGAKSTSTVQQSELASILSDPEKDHKKVKRENSTDQLYSTAALAKLGSASTLEDLLNTNENSSPASKENSVTPVSSVSPLVTRPPSIEPQPKVLSSDDKLFSEAPDFDMDTDMLNSESKSLVDNLIKRLDNSGEGNAEHDVPNNVVTTSSNNGVMNVVAPVESKSNNVYKSEEKTKEKKKRKEDKDRDKPPITMKLFTKDATFVAESRGNFPKNEPEKERNEIASVRPSKSGKDLKISIRSNPQPSGDPFELHSDEETPPPIHTPRLSSSGPTLGGKPISLPNKYKSDIVGESREKKKRKYLSSESGKRKRDESKKESGKRKKRTHESSSVDVGESDEKHKMAYLKSSTTIKITTVDGKMKIENPSKSISTPPVGSKNSSSKNLVSSSDVGNSKESKSVSTLKVSVSEKSGSPYSGKAGKPTSSSKVGRSKSASSIGSGKVDSKLTQGPLIKLKPVTITASSSSVTLTTSKQSTSPVAATAKTTPSQSLPPGGATRPRQLLKSRRGSINDVVDLLKKAKGGNSSGSSSGEKSKKDNITPEKKETFLDKIDPTASKRDQMEMIRKQIVHEGTKPSTPTKELSIPKARLGSGLSFKKLDHSKLATSENKNEPRRQEGVSKSANISGSSSSFKNTPHPTSKSPVPAVAGKSNSYSSPGRTPPQNTYGSRTGNYPGRQPAPSSQWSAHPHEPGKTENSRVPPVYSNAKDSRDPASAGSKVSNVSKTASRELARGEALTKTDHEPQVRRESVPLVKENNTGQKRKDPEPAKEEDKNKKNKLEEISEKLQSRHFTDIVSKLSDPDDSDEKGKEGPLVEDISDDCIASPDEVEEPSGPDPNLIPLTQEPQMKKAQGEAAQEPKNENGVPSVGPVNCEAGHSRDGSDFKQKEGANKYREENDINSTENKENKASAGEDLVFKAPTPKPVRSAEKERCEKSKSESRSRPLLSPRSDVSSPDDGLVIDCPNANSPCPSRIPRSPLNPSPVQEIHDNVALSPVNKYQEAISPRKSPAIRNLPSPMPAKSPASKSPGSVKSGCEIDDDLMDEALLIKENVVILAPN